MMITLVNSFDPDQARQNMVPELDQNCLSLRVMVFQKSFFKKVTFLKRSAATKKHAKLPSMHRFKSCLTSPYFRVLGQTLIQKEAKQFIIS